MTVWIYLFIVIAGIYLVKVSRKRREVSIENAQRFMKKGQYDQAEGILVQMVDSGSTPAMLVLGNMYMEAGRGKDAAALLARIADKGYTPAGQMLADMFWEGRGVERDPAKAKEVLLPFAENGDAFSQFRLGQYYREDNDPGRAKKWLELAAKNGSREAVKELEAMRT